MASSFTISGPPSGSSQHLLVARPSEEKTLACQRLGELFGLTVPASEQACFEAAWEMCRARNWTLLRQCQEELNQIVNEHGRSLIQQAIRVGEIALATEMIANGIAIHARDAVGNTAMHYAVQTESLNLISKLYEHISQDAQNFHGQTPLHFAASRGQMDVIRMLMANGANLGASTQVPIHDLNAHASLSIGDLTLPNLTPLAFAAIRGDQVCVDLFLSENQKNPALNLNLRFGTIGNLVHLLITFHHMHLLKFLLQKHNEQIFLLLDERNSRGLTPLMLAAYLGEEKALELLRDKVNLEATDCLGRTAVHHAVLGKQKQSLAYLHSFGVNLMVPDAENKFPLNLLDGRVDAESLSVIGYLSNLCKQNAKTEHTPPNFIADPPENLVFKGDDPTGLAYLGVIKTLGEDKKNSSRIRRVAGASTGTLLAMLFAIGYSFEEMVSKARFFSSFFDSPIAGQAMSEVPKSAPQMVTLQKLLEITQKDSPLGKDQFKTLHQLPSLCSGKALLDWIEERIYEKTGIHDCTFGELKRLVQANPQFKHLTVFTTRFGDTLTLARFSSEDPFSNDIVISHAVCAALSVPGVFPLKTLYTKNEAGGVDESPSLGNHGDAATINNFPIEAYDFEKFQSVRPLKEEARENFRLNKKTLGFALEARGKNYSFFEIVTVQELLEKVLELYCQMEPSTQSTTLYNRFRVVQVRNATVLDRDRERGAPLMLPEMKMQLMINIGEEAIMEFFEEQKRSVPSINHFLLMSGRTNPGMEFTNLKSPLPYFVGRIKQIQTLKEKLISATSSTAASSSGASSSSGTSSSLSQNRSCVVLAGAGGVGKSETAIAFANQYREKFSVVWWIETATPESMDQSFRELAEALDFKIDLTSSAETTRRRIYHFLQTEILRKPYLLIFDNAEEFIELPSGNGSILVTTTQPDHFFSEEILPIMPLTEDESINLIARILKQEPNEEMKHLAAELEYLPAILSQAVQYIRTTPGMTLPKYLDLLAKEKIQVLSMMPVVDSRYSKAQFSTWRVTHETLLQNDSVAYEWLEICAFLQPDAIPSLYLETWLENFKGEQSYVERMIKKDQILRALVSIGILRYNEESDSYSLHRIRQEMIKQLLMESETSLSENAASSSSSPSAPISEPSCSNAKQKSLALMAAVVKKIDLETDDDGSTFAPHEVQIRAALRTVDGKLRQSKEYLDLIDLFVEWMLIRGQYYKVMELLNEAQRIRLELYLSNTMTKLSSEFEFDPTEVNSDEERYQLSQKKNNVLLWVAARKNCNVLQAPLLEFVEYVDGPELRFKYCKEYYKALKKMYPPDHPEVAACLLLSVDYFLTDIDKREKYANRAIEIYRGIYPNGHQKLALALSSKAIVLRDADRLSEACAVGLEAGEMLEKSGSKNHSICISILKARASISDKQGYHEEALSDYKRAIESYIKISPCHPEISLLLDQIGELGMKNEDLEESAGYFSQYLHSYNQSGNMLNIIMAISRLMAIDIKLKNYRSACHQLSKIGSLLEASEKDNELPEIRFSRCCKIRSFWSQLSKERLRVYELAVENLEQGNLRAALRMMRNFILSCDESGISKVDLLYKTVLSDQIARILHFMGKFAESSVYNMQNLLWDKMHKESAPKSGFEYWVREEELRRFRELAEKAQTIIDMICSKKTVCRML